LKNKRPEGAKTVVRRDGTETAPFDAESILPNAKREKRSLAKGNLRKKEDPLPYRDKTAKW